MKKVVVEFELFGNDYKGIIVDDIKRLEDQDNIYSLSFNSDRNMILSQNDGINTIKLDKPLLVPMGAKHSVISEYAISEADACPSDERLISTIKATGRSIDFQIGGFSKIVADYEEMFHSLKNRYSKFIVVRSIEEVVEEMFKKKINEHHSI